MEKTQKNKRRLYQPRDAHDEWFKRREQPKIKEGLPAESKVHKKAIKRLSTKKLPERSKNLLLGRDSTELI